MNAWTIETNDSCLDADTLDYVPTTDSAIPEPVRAFILAFQRNLKDGNVYELSNNYEDGFNRLTERFFASQPWPNPDTHVNNMVNDGLLFQLVAATFLMIPQIMSF